MRMNSHLQMNKIYSICTEAGGQFSLKAFKLIEQTEQ